MAGASAERERQGEIEDQQRADNQAAERIRGLLDSDLSFLILIAEAVDEALKYVDIGTDLKAFGISVDGPQAALQRSREAHLLGGNGQLRPEGPC